MVRKKSVKHQQVSKIPLIISLICFVLPFYLLKRNPIEHGYEGYALMYFFLLGIMAVCYYPLRRILQHDVSDIERIPVAIVILGFFLWAHYYYFFKTDLDAKILVLIMVAAFIGMVLRYYLKNLMAD